MSRCVSGLVLLSQLGEVAFDGLPPRRQGFYQRIHWSNPNIWATEWALGSYSGPEIGIEEVTVPACDHLDVKSACRSSNIEFNSTFSRLLRLPGCEPTRFCKPGGLP